VSRFDACGAQQCRALVACDAQRLGWHLEQVDHGHAVQTQRALGQPTR
jgi:hypothetical protein